MGGKRGTLAERFWAKVQKGSPVECWPWLGAKQKGYGTIRLNGRNVMSTHLALELNGRPRPAGMHALHSCDTPACVAPHHLRWGTEQENKDDMVTRGRSTLHERHPNAKLTAEHVVEIRALLRDGLSQREVAQRYGIQRPAVSKIARGRTWRAT